MSNSLHQTDELQSADNLASKPKSKITIHSVLVVLMLSLVFTFAFVMGISYFFDNNTLKGHSSKYFCPSKQGNEVSVCLKS